MWAKAKQWAKVAAAAPFLVLFIGFGIGTSVSAPGYAVVYADDAAKTFTAPMCVAAYQKKNAGSGALRPTTIADVDARRYGIDHDCMETGAFSQDGPSLTGLLLEHVGLLPRKTYWWDERAARPAWSAADERDATAATGPLVDCVWQAAAFLDDGKRAVDDVANMADMACDHERVVALGYMNAACVKLGYAPADCHTQLDAIVHKKEVALVSQSRAKIGVSALQARARGG